MSTAAFTTLVGRVIFCIAAQFLERDIARTLAD